MRIQRPYMLAAGIALFGSGALMLACNTQSSTSTTPTTLTSAVEPANEAESDAVAQATAKAPSAAERAPAATKGPAANKQPVAGKPKATSNMTADWPMWGGSGTRNNVPEATGIPTSWNVGGFDRKTGAWLKDKAENIKW